MLMQLKQAFHWTLVIAATLSIVALRSIALAGDAPIHLLPVPQAGESIQLQGKVRFEKRTTIVAGCIECAPAEIYWGMIIHQGGHDFEIDQVFAPGITSSPDAIRLEDAFIRPGADLLLTATFRVDLGDRLIVSDPRYIQVLGESPTPRTPDPADVYGWRCVSREVRIDGPGRRVLADVSFSGDLRDRYRLRVLESVPGDERAFHEVTRIEGVLAATRDGEIHYQGDNDSYTALLVIDSASSEGRLHLNGAKRLSDDSIAMSCDSIRTY